MKPPPFISNPVLDGIRHGFFTRHGGVSRGGYESLNGGLRSGDDMERVSANRALAATAIGGTGASIRSLHQIHSATVHEADPDADSRPEGDGIVTAIPGLTLTILTADCAPVLLVDRDAGVIGAAHAGWRGAARGVIPAVCDAMCGLGAKRQNIAAVIGPAIGRQSYQVGGEMRDEVLAANLELNGSAADDFFTEDGKAGKFRFDLAGYGLAQLRASGVTLSTALAIDTYTNTGFFSHRRHCHGHGHGDTDNGNGRMLSMICL